MLTLLVHLQAAIVTNVHSMRLAPGTRRVSGDRGQTTAEYALVLLGASAIALLVLAWATKTKRIGGLFDFVLDQVVGRVV